MLSVAFLSALLFVYTVHVQGRDPIPERTCATLASPSGESFTLNDFDQSVNLKRDYRFSLQGWKETGSILVEKGCQLITCTDTYFQGSCSKYSSNEATLHKNFSSLLSANCTCERWCNCDNNYVTSNKLPQGIIGRAYLRGGCDTCNAEYIELSQNQIIFPERDKDSVEGLIFYSFCSIQFFTEAYHSGDELDAAGGEVLRERYGPIGSYTTNCNPVAPKQPPTKFNTYLPSRWDSLDEILHSSKVLENHPGLKAMRHSLKIKRSPRYVYVLLFSDEDDASKVGFPQCNVADNSKISECHIRVGVDSLRLKAELRIVKVPTAAYLRDTNSLAVKLEKYLSTHPELNATIPNVVVFNHVLNDDAIGTEGSAKNFIGKLTVIKSLRNRLIDEKYSNLIFLLSELQTLSEKERKQPEANIAKFDEVIKDKLPFLKPVAFAVASDGDDYNPSHSVNGHVKMENDEYWPLNLDRAMVNICNKTGDTLGLAIFKAYFLDNWTPYLSIEPIEQ